MDDLLQVLRAAGESTRLRIVAALEGREFTVSELCQILGQSQPRVSRHLKVLVDAGLLVRSSEGVSAFYRTASDSFGRAFVDKIRPMISSDDPLIVRDRERIAAVRAERAVEAEKYFASIASDWGKLRELHVGDDLVETALLDAVGDRSIGTVLDVGTGTARMLELFGPNAERGIGVDFSPRMLTVARAQLDASGLAHCRVRKGDVHNLDLDLDLSDSVDVSIVHQVLHFLDDPELAVAQVARTLRPGGQLLIADFLPHTNERLRTEFSHRRMGFRDDEVIGWCESVGLRVRPTRFLTRESSVDSELGSEPLTVAIWDAVRVAGHDDLHSTSQEAVA